MDNIIGIGTLIAIIFMCVPQEKFENTRRVNSARTGN